MQVRWNYEDQRWEKWASPRKGEPEQWIEDINKRDDLRANLSPKKLQSALLDSENWSWTTLSKRWGYTKAYLNRLIDKIVREDLTKKYGSEVDYYKTLKQLEPNDPVLQTKKAKAELKKWDKVVKTIKDKLRDRPDRTRQETREKMGQQEREGNLFDLLLKEK
jgi:DNA-binding MarR family transcriptional regulator